MELPKGFKNVKYIEVDYWDIEELAKKIWNQDLELPCSEEWGNDTNYTISVRRYSEDIDSYDQAKLDKFISTGQGSYGICGIILEAFYRIGLIPKGDYLVKVSW